MPSLNIRHVTTYRYRRPVSFGEHRMMFRPHDPHDQKVIWANLEINPDPSSLRFFQDAFGNHVGIARFSSCARELQFESTVRIEHLASDVFNLGVEELPRPFPITYAADEFPDIAHCIRRFGARPGERGRPMGSSIPAPELVNSTFGVSGKPLQRDSSGVAFTAGAKQKEFSALWKRCGLAMARAEISRC